MTQTVQSITPAAFPVFLLTGDGTGNFTNKLLPLTGHQGAKIVVADVNDDGHQDILIAYPISAADGGEFEVWLGDGAENFFFSGATALPPGDVSVAQGDFNGDGKTGNISG